jgi:triacylglycerol esterase/lipase EstA (alpha/beta hydrolase family)
VPTGELVLSPPVRRALAAAVGVALLALPGTASALDYAPVDTPGPPLIVPQSDLDASLSCNGNLAEGPTPVLLVHGTGSNPQDNFSWNWALALEDLGIAWCTVALPGNGMEDVQVGGEHVVHAIRTMHAQAGRRISILGHSQGGMIPRWALRFWPDTRAMVDDKIGFAASNHGTASAQFTCLPDCAPAIWQQRDDSEFIKALNSHQETFAGISYTEIYTRTDPVVTPNLDETGSSSLRTGDGQIENVAIQDVCAADVSEHLAVGTLSNTAYALAIDALTHPGPADPSRIDTTSVCINPFMPNLAPTFLTDAATAAANLLATIATYPHVPAEPALACYVTAGCGQAPTAASATKAKCKKKKRKKRGRVADSAKKKPKKCKKGKKKKQRR